MKRLLLLLFIPVVITSCQCSEQPSESITPESSFTEQDAMTEGAKISGQSQSVLAGVLQQKIQESGFEHAVNFCNVNARALADSLSLEYNATVRRTSFRVRNSENTPDSLDRVMLAKFEYAFENDEKPVQSVIQDEQGNYRYYNPILIAPVCLNCHGMPGEELSADLHALILEKYPEDDAVEYELGDLRGAWVVEFAIAVNDIQ
ncbi:MAG: DUF3365 domain-containing protein [Flavobacteriia bacterium]|nr:DUF3365 domain-containing protein [Flavobacteriia bacterium]